jgi:ABC-2 type transport system ATP-binding protein
LPDIIEVKNLRKTYGETVAVDDISFEVSEGEIFGLLGPNGAGKTTTVEIIQALRQPDSGTINVLGLDPRRDATALRRQIGSQLQESALPDRLRVWEALDLFASMTPHALDWQVLLEQWGLDRAAVYAEDSDNDYSSPFLWSIIPASFSSMR